MKILNIFKKENKKAVVATTKKLDKTQLEKVIGGGGSDIPLDTEGTGIRKGSVKGNLDNG